MPDTKNPSALVEVSGLVEAVGLIMSQRRYIEYLEEENRKFFKEEELKASSYRELSELLKEVSDRLEGVCIEYDEPISDYKSGLPQLFERVNTFFKGK